MVILKEIEIKTHKNNIVSKSNELIKAKGVLSATAQKMLASVISMIKSDDTEFQEYALRIDDYLKLIKSNSNNKNFLKKQAEELMSNPFVIDGKMFNWCSMVDLEKMQGYLIFSVHEKLRPYLLELREKGNFTQYHIINILSLKGEYSPRLYEYIVMGYNQYKKYNPHSKKYTFELEIKKLIDLFRVPKSYRYNNIKERVIDKAQKQFKEKTNIKFTYKEQKLGRKVVRLQITVEDNRKGSNDILSTRKSFINYIRKEYKPDPENNIFPIIISTQNGDLKVNLQGEIYLSGADENKNYNSKSSNQLWDWLYKLAKEDLKNLSNPKQKIY